MVELTFDKPGHYVSDRLAPLIAQVRALVRSREGVWNPETLTGVQFSLANALQLDGEQSGKNEPLAESIELYRQVLDENICERGPLYWAGTQNNLGLALQRLDKRKGGTAGLEAAIVAFREASTVLTRERQLTPTSLAGHEIMRATRLIAGGPSAMTSFPHDSQGSGFSHAAHQKTPRHFPQGAN